MNVEFRLLAGAAVLFFSIRFFELARTEECNGEIFKINAATQTIQCAKKTTAGHYERRSLESRDQAWVRIHHQF